MGVDTGNSTPNSEVIIASSIIRGSQVGADDVQVWGGSSVVNTTKIKMWSKPITVRDKYEFLINNPSLVTDLSWALYNRQILADDSALEYLLSDFPITIPKSTYVVLEDCEDVWDAQQGANSVMATDAVNFKVGTKSVSIALGADCPVGLVASEAISSANLTPYTHLYGWIKSNVGLDAGDFQLLLDDTNTCASPLESLNIPAVTTNTWTRFIIPLFNPGIDLAVICIGLKQIIDKGAVTILLDDIRAVAMSAASYIVSGAFNDCAVDEKKSNLTVLGADDSFSSITRIREA